MVSVPPIPSIGIGMVTSQGVWTVSQVCLENVCRVPGGWLASIYGMSKLSVLCLNVSEGQVRPGQVKTGQVGQVKSS